MAFMLLDEYTNLIGVCLTCGSSRRIEDTVIDLGCDTDVAADIDGQPTFRTSPAQICSTCAAEIATMLGWPTDQVARQIVEMRGVISAQAAELKALRRMRDAVESARV